MEENMMNDECDVYVLGNIFMLSFGFFDVGWNID
jgi:hypothetical protein